MMHCSSRYSARPSVEQRVSTASAEQIDAWTARLLSAPTLAELLAD
jgi:hypothetical protein